MILKKAPNKIMFIANSIAMLPVVRQQNAGRFYSTDA